MISKRRLLVSIAGLLAAGAAKAQPSYNLKE
jgi:hypothetical protein